LSKESLLGHPKDLRSVRDAMGKTRALPPHSRRREDTTTREYRDLNTADCAEHLPYTIRRATERFPYRARTQHSEHIGFLVHSARTIKPPHLRITRLSTADARLEPSRPGAILVADR